MGTVLPSGSVALCLVAVRLTVPVETTVAGGSAIATADGEQCRDRDRSHTQQRLGEFVTHELSPDLFHWRPHFVSSMDADGGSMMSIIIKPPGNTLFVVISRSLCECHMYA